MTRSRNAKVKVKASHSLLWSVAEKLPLSTAPIQRAKGPHRGWSAVGWSLFAAGLLWALASWLIPNDSGSAWLRAAQVLSIFVVAVGLVVVVWAGNETALRVFNWAMRSSDVLERVMYQLGSLICSGVVAVFLTIAVLDDAPTGHLVFIAFAQVVAVGLSVLALGEGPPLVGVLTRAVPGRTQGLSLAVWLLACVVFGYGAVVVASKFQGQIATIGVTITIAVVFFAAYTQQRNAFELRRENLQKALSKLYIHLTTDGKQSDIIEAALGLEAVLTPYHRAPLSLPIQQPLDDRLRACLFYALTEVTGLPYREVRTNDADPIRRRLADSDVRQELVEFVWELRRRTLRTNRDVRRDDARAHNLPQALVPAGQPAP